MSEIDVSQWPTLDEAAAQLQTSPRTLQRQHRRGMLELRKRPRSGRKPENVCNPADLERLQATAYVLPPETPPKTTNGIATRVPRAGSTRLSESILERLALALPPPAGCPAVPLDRKLWLTLEEASAYSGFGRSVLERGIADGQLTAEKRGPRRAWIVQRASLEIFAG